MPLVADGELIGVWDVDSPQPGRFDDADRIGMEALCTVFIDSLRVREPAIARARA